MSQETPQVKPTVPTTHNDQGKSHPIQYTVKNKKCVGMKEKDILMLGNNHHHLYLHPCRIWCK
jgi:hypothetical protein